VNLILKTDGYKLSHYEQYPPGTKGIYSYLEARGGKDDFGNGETVFFGLQYLIEKHLTGHVFNMNDIKDAEAFHSKYMPNCKFNTQGWAEMYKEYGGRLPVIINAVPEGSVVPVGNVLMIIENTDDRFFWLTNYLETLLMQVWYPITVASQSYYLKKKLLKFHRLSSDEPESYVDYKLHDFGFRGVSSMETAAIGAAAHLLNFKGTDTLAGIQLLDEYYADETTSSCGSSIPASEHSTITSWGKSREVEAYRNMLKVYPEGFVACVSDSYDIFNACENIWGGELRDKVLNRDGVLVVRPDCYDEKTEILTNDGWKLFNSININTYVAQYNNGNIEFVKPVKYICQDYIGEMVSIFNDKRGVDLLVTPNHRCYTKNKKGEIFVKQAKDIKYYHDRNHIMAGKLTCLNPILFTPEHAIKIAFQADGSYESNHNQENSFKNGFTKIRFNFTKQRKIERIIKICEEGCYEYSIHQEKERENQKTIYVKVPFSIFKDFKWVNDIINNIDYKYCQQFIEECSYWDGTRRSDKRFKYDTTIGINAEIVQLLACFSGYKTKYSIAKDNRKDIFNDVHTVHIIKQDFIDGQGIEKTFKNYDGKVYCVTVPSGAIIVRRNHRISISGNSGDPLEVLPKILNVLGEKFGYTTNSKGFKVLNPKVRVIQGDGINRNSLLNILDTVCLTNKWSLDNLTFGSGGGLLQKLDRDTMGFAIKCSSIAIDDEEYDVYKEPVGQSFKTSKRGRLSLIKENGSYKTVSKKIYNSLDCLQTVFYNGYSEKTTNLSYIKQRLLKSYSV